MWFDEKHADTEDDGYLWLRDTIWALSIVLLATAGAMAAIAWRMP